MPRRNPNAVRYRTLRRRKHRGNGHPTPQTAPLSHFSFHSKPRMRELVR